MLPIEWVSQNDFLCNLWKLYNITIGISPQECTTSDSWYGRWELRNNPPRGSSETDTVLEFKNLKTKRSTINRWDKAKHSSHYYKAIHAKCWRTRTSRNLRASSFSKATIVSADHIWATCMRLAHIASIRIKFAADPKQLVTSYPVSLRSIARSGYPCKI